MCYALNNGGWDIVYLKICECVMSASLNIYNFWVSILTIACWYKVNISSPPAMLNYAASTRHMQCKVENCLLNALYNSISIVSIVYIISRSKTVS